LAARGLWKGGPLRQARLSWRGAARLARTK